MYGKCIVKYTVSKIKMWCPVWLNLHVSGLQMIKFILNAFFSDITCRY